MCELGAVMCLKWFKSEMWCAAKRVDWHLCLLKSITWTTKHRQRQNTPLQNAAVLFFNPMCSSPLKLVWCNKARGYKTNKNFLWFDTQKFRQGWFFFFFFWFGTKPFPRILPALTFYAVWFLGPRNLLGTDWMRWCLQSPPVVKFSFIVEFQGCLKDPEPPL